MIKIQLLRNSNNHKDISKLAAICTLLKDSTLDFEKMIQDLLFVLKIFEVSLNNAKDIKDLNLARPHI